jgi:hypothetical protein
MGGVLSQGIAVGSEFKKGTIWYIIKSKMYNLLNKHYCCCVAMENIKTFKLGLTRIGRRPTTAARLP